MQLAHSDQVVAIVTVVLGVLVPTLAALYKALRATSAAPADETSETG
jgi:hypothetical protein